MVNYQVMDGNLEMVKYVLVHWGLVNQNTRFCMW